jgi:hypothetical protein
MIKVININDKNHISILMWELSLEDKSKTFRYD